MKKRVIIIIIGVLTVLVGYISHSFFEKPTRKVSQNSEITINAAKILSEVWKNADVQGDSICKKASSASDLFYQCNPSYIKCALENKLIRKRLSA